MNNEQIDFSAIKSDAQKIFQQATQALDRFQDAVTSTSREAYSQVSANAAEFVRGIDTRKPARFVRRYPIQVTVAAIGLGFILGSLASRKID